MPVPAPRRSSLGRLVLRSGQPTHVSTDPQVSRRPCAVVLRVRPGLCRSPKEARLDCAVH
jgi:hypothetical protein